MLLMGVVCSSMGAFVGVLITVCTLSLSLPLSLLCRLSLAVSETSRGTEILESVVSDSFVSLDPGIVLAPSVDDSDWSC
jgi:hypothetical protein